MAAFVAPDLTGGNLIEPLLGLKFIAIGFE